MNEPSDIISEPSVPNLKYEKPDPQTGDDDDDQPIKLSEGYDILSLFNYVNECICICICKNIKIYVKA